MHRLTWPLSLSLSLGWIHVCYTARNYQPRKNARHSFDRVQAATAGFYLPVSTWNYATRKSDSPSIGWQRERVPVARLLVSREAKRVSLIRETHYAVTYLREPWRPWGTRNIPRETARSCTQNVFPRPDEDSELHEIHFDVEWDHRTRRGSIIDRATSKKKKFPSFFASANFVNREREATDARRVWCIKRWIERNAIVCRNSAIPDDGGL